MMNTRMQMLLKNLAIPNYLLGKSLIPELVEIVNAELIEIQGCFFLEPLLRPAFDINYAFSRYPGRMAIEETFNAIHIKYFMKRGLQEDSREILAQAILFACNLLDRLRARGLFIITVGFGGPELPGWGGITSCVIRFYLERLDEESRLAPDLEDYHDAVLVFRSDDPTSSEINQLCWKNESDNIPDRT